MTSPEDCYGGPHIGISTYINVFPSLLPSFPPSFLPSFLIKSVFFFKAQNCSRGWVPVYSCTTYSLHTHYKPDKPSSRLLRLSLTLYLPTYLSTPDTYLPTYPYTYLPMYPPTYTDSYADPHILRQREIVYTYIHR